MPDRYFSIPSNRWRRRGKSPIPYLLQHRFEQDIEDTTAASGAQISQTMRELGGGAGKVSHVQREVSDILAETGRGRGTARHRSIVSMPRRLGDNARALLPGPNRAKCPVPSQPCL
ncbi:MAG: hypothetical protein V4754_16655 [Pseudomonadota bacterium]